MCAKILQNCNYWNSRKPSTQTFFFLLQSSAALLNLSLKQCSKFKQITENWKLNLWTEVLVTLPVLINSQIKKKKLYRLYYRLFKYSVLISPYLFVISKLFTSSFYTAYPVYTLKFNFFVFFNPVSLTKIGSTVFS